MEKKCFVISPIGDEGSPERQHADSVFEDVIKPAMERLGVRAYRADHQSQLGRISEQMFDSILGDELCVAVLTFHNPNVFYELAVAQCAARPVIIMIQKGEKIPFDVRDLRVVEYDLSYRAVRDKVNEAKLVEFARAVLSGSWKAEVPFGSGLTPLGGGPAASASICERAADSPEHSDWEKWLGSSREYFWISAVSLYGWSRSRTFVKALQQKCEGGCKVRILLMDPENPSLPSYLVGTASTLEQLVTEIGLAGQSLRRVTDSPNLEIRRMKTAPHVQVTLNERDAVAYPYLLSAVRKEGPVIRAKAGGPLHATLRGEFEHLWKGATVLEGGVRVVAEPGP